MVPVQAKKRGSAAMSRISQGDLQCFGTVFIALSEAKERAVRAMHQGRCKRSLSFSEAASSQWKFHILLRKQTMFVMLTQRVNAAEQYLYVHARVLVATVNSGDRPQDASTNAKELPSVHSPRLNQGLCRMPAPVEPELASK